MPIGAIANAVTGGISSLAGSFINAKMQAQTNQLNWKMNQLNNQFNANEATKNRQFQEYMQDKQNEYNSAKNQRARLEAAGLNPYMMMNGGSAGTSTPASSGSSASAASPVAMQAARMDFSGVQDAINSFYANSKLAMETATGKSQLPFVSDVERARIANLIGNQSSPLLNNPAYQNFILSRPAAQLGASSFFEEATAKRLNNDLMRSQNSNLLLDAQSKKILNTFMPAQQQAEFWQKMATSWNLVQSGKLSQKRMETETYQQLKIAAETAGIKISNHVLKMTAASAIRAMNQANDVDYLYNTGFREHAMRIGRETGATQYKGLVNLMKDLKNKDTGFYRFLQNYGNDILSGIGILSGTLAPYAGFSRFGAGARQSGFRYRSNYSY